MQQLDIYILMMASITLSLDPSLALGHAAVEGEGS
jgi:hypothetical protein